MKNAILCFAALAIFATPILAPQPVAGAVIQQQAPLRIFLRGGPKTHGPPENGFHDHTRWMNEWKVLLESRGAKVAGSLQFPTAAELASTDVLVMFAADAGKIVGEQRTYFEGFVKRGGGVVVIHDALVTSQDPHWFKTIVGGSWENSVARYFEGENTYYYVNTEHPITKGASNFRINDEVYWALHMMPNAQILVSAMEPVRRGRNAPPPTDSAVGRLIPQIWVYQNQLDGGQPYRAYVNLLGHHYITFSSPHARAVLLRGIAWAGKRDVDLLTTPEEVAAMK